MFKSVELEMEFVEESIYRLGDEAISVCLRHQVGG